MAIFKMAGDSARFVWAADEDTDTSRGHAWQGWHYADGQPEGCTVVEVRAVSEDDVSALGEPAEAWKAGVVSIDGEQAAFSSWPPVFRLAVANLVTAVSTGAVSLVPPRA